MFIRSFGVGPGGQVVVIHSGGDVRIVSVYGRNQGISKVGSVWSYESIIITHIGDEHQQHSKTFTKAIISCVLLYIQHEGHLLGHSTSFHSRSCELAV